MGLQTSAYQPHEEQFKIGVEFPTPSRSARSCTTRRLAAVRCSLSRPSRAPRVRASWPSIGRTWTSRSARSQLRNAPTAKTRGTRPRARQPPRGRSAWRTRSCPPTSRLAAKVSPSTNAGDCRPLELGEGERYPGSEGHWLGRTHEQRGEES